MKTVNAYDVILSTIVTERSTTQSENTEHPKYTFVVADGANKSEIKAAIELIYNVKVTAVNTINVKGKVKRLRTKQGMTPAWKKAVVTLRRGDRIDFT
jgi:large subunit ribosomal protein L23